MLIAGNWKMNTDQSQAVALARDVVDSVGDSTLDVALAVCPPMVNLSAVADVVRGTAVRLGAQNMHAEPAGAYTGEVSSGMLSAIGCHYVIIGHSERRQYFCETDKSVNQKVRSAVASGIVPIVCVGEILAERDAGVQSKIVTRQVTEALADVSVSSSSQIVVAYEPVWAIGTGKTASPEQAQEMHAMIRQLLIRKYGESIGTDVDLLYGGSMNPKNADELLAQSDVSGGLIGGASLKADQFALIVEAARNAVS